MRLLALLTLGWAVAFPAVAQVQVACPAPSPAAICFQFPNAPIANWSWVPPVPLVTPAGLAAAVAKAKPGDTITLSGPPAAVLLRGFNFPTPVTITSADPAHPVVLNGLQISSGTGLRLVSVDIHKTAPANADDPVVLIQSSHFIELRSANVSGAMDSTGLRLGKGISLADSDHVTITGGSVFDLFKGVSFSNVSDAILQAADLHHVRTSPVNGGGELHRISILRNHIHDIVPDAAHGDHSDGIHFFGKVSKTPLDAILIQGNQMELVNADGTLGINLEGAANAGFTNVSVTGNILKWNNNQGIALNYVQSGDISGNMLTPIILLKDVKHAPSIIVKGRTLGLPAVLHITGNTSAPIVAFDKAYGTNTTLTPAQIASYMAQP